MSKLDSFLNNLKHLYTKLVLVSMHQRMHRYNPSIPTKQGFEIGQSLHKLVDETVVDISQTNSQFEVVTNKAIEFNKQLDRVAENEQPVSLTKLTLSTLSLYFDTYKAQEKDPGIPAKLRRCVWQHVHATHRYAHSGEKALAKLHADIACNAMKELSHYMNDDAYKQFYLEISKEIQVDL